MREREKEGEWKGISFGKGPGIEASDATCNWDRKKKKIKKKEDEGKKRRNYFLIFSLIQVEDFFV